MHTATYIAILIAVFWAAFGNTPYVSPICAIIIGICSFVSFFSYETLKDRIKALEDKLNNKENLK